MDVSWQVYPATVKNQRICDKIKGTKYLYCKSRRVYSTEMAFTTGVFHSNLFIIELLKKGYIFKRMPLQLCNYWPKALKTGSEESLTNGQRSLPSFSKIILCLKSKETVSRDELRPFLSAVRRAPRRTPQWRSFTAVPASVSTCWPRERVL